MTADPVPPSEKKLLNDSLVECSKFPLTMCWRHNTGMAWQGQRLQARVGQFVQVEPNMVILRNGHPITFGLPGSGDIIGVTDGIFWALEIKAESGRLEKSQPKFAAAFQRCGGRYIVSRSAVESRAFVESVRRGE